MTFPPLIIWAEALFFFEQLFPFVARSDNKLLSFSFPYLFFISDWFCSLILIFFWNFPISWVLTELPLAQLERQLGDKKKPGSKINTLNHGKIFPLHSFIFYIINFVSHVCVKYIFQKFFFSHPFSREGILTILLLGEFFWHILTHQRGPASHLF